MKPCSKNRRLIAWLALDSLEADRAGALREHFESCGGCRLYFEELSQVTASLRAAEPSPSREAGANFHRRVVARVRAETSSSVQSSLKEIIRSFALSWRVVLPVAAGTAVIIGLLLIIAQPRSPERPGMAHVPVAAGAARDLNVDDDLAPTVSNYQMVANRSLDKLDQLLTEQGARNLPRVVTYTAGAAAPERE